MVEILSFIPLVVDVSRYLVLLLHTPRATSSLTPEQSQRRDRVICIQVMIPLQELPFSTDSCDLSDDSKGGLQRIETNELSEVNRFYRSVDKTALKLAILYF